METKTVLAILTKALEQISNGHPYKAGKEARPLMSTEMARIAEDALAKVAAKSESLCGSCVRSQPCHFKQIVNPFVKCNWHMAAPPRPTKSEN